MGLPIQLSGLVADANLVSYWKFDGNSNDSKGSNNGVDVNVTYGAGTFGQSAGYVAASLSHTNLATMAINYTNTSAFSWAIWVNFSDTTTGYFMTSNVSPGAGNLFVDLNKDGYVAQTVSFEVGKSGTGVTHIDSSATYKTGVWELYVGTYDGSNNMVLYRNGVSVGTATYSNGTAGSSGLGLYFGFANNLTNYITGNLDDAAVFSRALTAAEVKRIWSAGKFFPFFGQKQGVS